MMSKVAVVYWSGTGNTEQMAQQVAEGAKQAGAQAVLLTAAEFGADQMDAFSAVAFGCPSMGSEQLEESEFDPMFQACRAKLNGKKNRLVRLLWLGRWPMDARLGRNLPRRRRRAGRRAGHLQRSTGRRGQRKLPLPGESACLKQPFLRQKFPLGESPTCIECLFAFPPSIKRTGPHPFFFYRAPGA